jgi:hypothetical protein
MIWHIFRKDWKLLWQMVLGVALINAIERILHWRIGILRDRLNPLFMTNLLGILSLLAMGILIVLVVQQDPIPGLRQDWLVRPIRRTHLLLSKVLFVVILVQGPVFIAEVIQGLAIGFPLMQALTAPLSRNLWMLLAMDLPLMAFAGLTRNLVEAIGGGLAAGVLAALSMNFALSLNPDILANISGVGWVTDSIRTAWGLMVAGALLALLYFRRKAVPARWIFGSATVLWLLAALLPWQTAFAIQERFSAQPVAADPVQIMFEPGAERLRWGSEFFQSAFPRVRDDAADLFVPLRASGVPSGYVLYFDRATIRLSPPGRGTIDLDQKWPQGFVQGPFHQPVTVPRSVHADEKGQAVRLEIGYELTLLKADSDQTLPALDGNQWIPGEGRCATRMSGDATQVGLGCIAPGNTFCAATFLENARLGLRIPGHANCDPDYAPYFGRIEGDSTSRFSALFLPSGLDASAVREARVIVRVYRPVAHFTRHVVIPDIKLADWRAK